MSFVITDSNVKRLYGDVVVRSLRSSGVSVDLLAFPAGEASKNERVVGQLATQLLRRGVTRESIIIALGGGVVGDVAGFVAATLLRGLGYVQVPTTLLAQVDSSVGGKVGIDHPMGKNLIGAFHQPLAVCIDPNVLRTLPAREFRNGLAEVAKIAVALDGGLFRFLERRALLLGSTHAKVMSHVIARAVGLKAAVVERDEREAGLRKALNAGHTIGHALEAASHYKLPHGVAVAQGLAAEARIAYMIGLLRLRDLTRLTTLMYRLGLPTEAARISDRRAFRRALVSDKKRISQAARFVLLRGIGRCAIDVEVPPAVINDLLNLS